MVKQEEIERYKSNFPFTWCPDPLPYLGIQIPHTLLELYCRNHLTILEGMCKDMHSWNSINVFWFGRAAFVKMLLLLCILYILQMVPIHVPLSFCSTYKRVCSRFIWRQKKTRDKILPLNLTQAQGFSTCLFGRLEC